MAKLIFFDDGHTYQADGETVPSVSEIIRFMSREVYDSIMQFRLDNAADRGTKVHKAVENIARYGSCEVTEDIEPYVRAYVQFLKDKRPQWLKVEHAMYSDALGYAGTMDRYGVIDGRRLVVDVKSNSQIKVPIVGAQLNGYDILAEENGLPADGVAVLHLMKNGLYRFKELPIDSASFMACLTLHNALKKKPRKKKPEVSDGTADTDSIAGE